MRGVIVSLVLVLAAVGCGDDDDGGGLASGGGGGDFCEEAESVRQLGEAFDDFDPEGLQTASDAIDDLAASAPDEISDDMAVMQDAIQQLVDAFDGVDPDDDEATAEALASLQDLDTEEIEAASNRIEEFVQEECDIDLSGDDDGTDDGSSDDGSSDDGSSEEAGDPEPIPDDVPADLEERTQDCFDGDMEACDEVFFESESDSELEDWANRCGGRFEETPGLCSEVDG
jgi:hypothetical protein